MRLVSKRPVIRNSKRSIRERRKNKRERREGESEKSFDTNLIERGEVAYRVELIQSGRVTLK